MNVIIMKNSFFVFHSPAEKNESWFKLWEHLCKAIAQDIHTDVDLVDSIYGLFDAGEKVSKTVLSNESIITSLTHAK